MALPHRAVQAEDKAARRIAILDAAEALIARDPENLASVAQVAEAAGLAKGTVYLYFETKEEVIMAVHARHAMQLFEGIDLLLGEPGARISVEQVIDRFCAFVRATPLFLQLGCFCHLTVERHVNVEAVYQFRLQTAARMRQAGALLELQFPALPGGGGMQLLHDTYCFALGAWQLAEPAYLGQGGINERPGMEHFRRDFYTDLRRGLLALWCGHLSAPADRGAAAAALPASAAVLPLRVTAA
jgi:AcrR family transcriptional regulator